MGWIRKGGRAATVEAETGAQVDPLDDLPAAPRAEVVAAVRAALGVEEDVAEDLLRASEPLWEAMEAVGGLVDTWGGSEFCALFPRLLVFIRTGE